MPQKIIAARAPAKARATSRITSGATPQSGAIRSGSNPFRCSAKASNPSVKPSMYCRSVSPSATITFMIALRSATSVPGRNCSIARRVPPEPHAARVHHVELAAALDELLEVGGRHRVVLGRVGADDDRDVGVLDLVEGGGDRRRADVLHQRRDGRGVAEPGAVVDVVVPEGLADQLLEEVRLLVRALGAAEPGDRLAAVPGVEPAQAPPPPRRAPRPRTPRGSASTGSPDRRSSPSRARRRGGSAAPSAAADARCSRSRTAP